MLPYVLFAYKKVPQSTKGFSPFELLHGKEVSGCWIREVMRASFYMFCWMEQITEFW